MRRESRGRALKIDRLAWINARDGAVRTIKSFEAWRIPSEISLSPKGDWIAFSATSRAGSTDHYIYVVSADGQNDTAVVKIAGSSTQPTWTPDGSHLVFVNERSASRALWAVALQGGTAGTEPTLMQAGFAGTLIRVTQPGDLYVAQQKGGDSSVVIGGGSSPAQSGFSGMSATWSPDGKSIAFFRDGELIVRATDTGEERQYSQPGLGVASPRWFHRRAPHRAAVLVRLYTTYHLVGPTGYSAVCTNPRSASQDFN